MKVVIISIIISIITVYVCVHVCMREVSDNDSNIIHVVWYFLMLYNCLVLLSCIISTVGCIAYLILSYLMFILLLIVHDGLKYTPN